MMRFGSVRKYILGLLFSVSALLALISSSARIYAQQKELGDVTILTAVPNMAFSAVWVAEPGV